MMATTGSPGAGPGLLRVLPLLMLVLACGLTEGLGSGERTGPAVADEARPPVSLGPPPPRGAPPLDACARHEDCQVAVTGPMADHPCCDETWTARPVALAYLRWIEGWRPAHCAGVRCPDLRLPGALLAPCGYEARCVGGRCANACGDPTFDEAAGPLAAPR